YMGIVYSGCNAIDKAIEAFSKAIHINPSYKDARIKLGILYCHQAAYVQALVHFQEASRLDPSDTNLAAALEDIQNILTTPESSESCIAAALSQCFGSDKPIAQAVQEFNKHIKIVPDFSDMLLLIQSFSENDASLCTMLIPLITDYIAQHPKYPDLHNALGSLFVKLQKYAEAEHAFRNALDLNPAYLNARINLLKVLCLQNKTADVIEQSEVLTSYHPECLYPDICCMTADVLLAAGETQKAQEHVHQALRTNPQYCYAHYLQGRLYELQGDVEHAIQSYQQCRSCRPSRDLAEKAEQALKKLTGI
ncbi:MAG: tetratricopeptide repeat protein, partial [Desulfobacterota bacterium]|nr:tetratricopeptide repeat protein [Thermodesulfobacteriota bacterium]